MCLNKDLEYCGYLSVCPSEVRMAGMDRVKRRKLDGQTSAPGRLDRGGAVSEPCASWEVVLEGVVSEASELWNKDPIVVLLTWDTVSVLQHFTGVVGLQPQGVPSPRPACVSFHLAGSHSGGGSIERPRNLWLCLFVKDPL